MGLCLCKRITVPAYMQEKLSVLFHRLGILHTEPNPSVQERYGMIVNNIVHYTSLNGWSDSLVSNFSSVDHTLPKMNGDWVFCALSELFGLPSGAGA